MFSEKLIKYAEEKFSLRKEILKEIYSDIVEGLKKCNDEEAVLMKFFYGTMPIRDAGEYGFDIFLGYVRHALWLRENIERCKSLPEYIFLHYVLYYRINSENITDCREFFYNHLKDRIEGKGDKEAVIEVNYWCAENATYETTDERTMSPITMYKACAGRCGEESTFTVTALRSVGIPARQVYTPWWAHCDDNHAWVEVYISGKWYFIGACEPEEVLNRGWFLGASTRAILIYARTFSDFMDNSSEEYIGKNDGLFYYNSTANYTEVRSLNISVYDKEENPVEGAEISIEILNMARFANATTLFTDCDGKVKITLGKGDINIRAMKDGIFAEKIVTLEDGNFIKIILDKGMNNIDFVADKWENIDVSAPVDKTISQVKLTSEVEEKNKLRIKEVTNIRKEKEKKYYIRKLADKFNNEKEILKLSKGNFNEVYKFLSKDNDNRRGKLLKTLSIKDYKDLKADILEEHLQMEQGDFSDEIYFKYLLCPRVYFEEITNFRSYINNYFSDEIKRKFKTNPYLIWEYVEKNIEYIPEFDYKTICSTPIGCLKLKKGNPLSKKILFVAICRTLGIPAYLNKVTSDPEYWNNGEFIVIKESKIKKESTAELILKVDNGSEWGYYKNYTLGILKNDRFVTLNYEGIKFSDNSLRIELDEGIYRFITTFRMPNGNQKASKRIFRIAPGEKKIIEMKLRERSMKDMLVSTPILEFELMRKDGLKTKFSDIFEGKNGILAFLDEGKEPTEHVLNEMMVSAKELNTMTEKIIFVVRNPEVLTNITIKKTLRFIPEIQVYFDENFENVEPLARRMYVDPEKLPLLIAIKNGLTGIYACSGYNVGSVDLIRKIIKYEE